MLSTLGLIAPIFILIALGYAAAARHILSQTALRGMGRFVVAFCLPALIFQAIVSQPIAKVINPAYFFGYTSGSLVSFALGFAIARLRGQTGAAAAVNAFGQSMANTGFIGYPLLITVIGTHAGSYFTLNVLTENLIMLPLFLLIGDSYAMKGENRARLLLTIFRNLLKNPMIIALLAGLFIALTGASRWLPAPFLKAISMLAASGAPLALFVIGGALVGLKIHGSLPDIVQITAGKLFLHPALAAGFTALFGGTREAIFAAALLGGITCASMFPILGARYGHQRRAAAALLTTTSLSIITITLIIYTYERLF